MKDGILSEIRLAFPGNLTPIDAKLRAQGLAAFKKMLWRESFRNPVGIRQRVHEAEKIMRNSKNEAERRELKNLILFAASHNMENAIYDLDPGETTFY